MPTSPSDESIQAQQAAHVALAMLGANAYAEIVKLWGDVALGSGRASKSALKAFVTAALKVVALRRRQAAQVTIASQRLQRALRVGEPLEIPDVIPTERPRGTLDEVRKDFQQTIKTYAPAALKKTVPPEIKGGDMARREDNVPKGIPSVERRPYALPAPSSDGARELIAEKVKSLERDLAGLDERWQKMASEMLSNVAAESVTRAEERADTDQGAKRREVEKEAHSTAGRRLGATAAAVVRGMSHEIDLTTAKADKRVRGYVRIHYSFNGNGPCAFCAMMLSRGVTYKSAKSAGGGFGSPFQYHPNCKCKGEVVYVGEDFDNDPRFKVNRFYAKKWKDLIAKKKLTGDEARRAWRKHIDAFNKGRES